MIGENDKMYKPLPNCLTIRESEIHGLGIFATESIDINFDLGIAHVELPNYMPIVPRNKYQQYFMQGHCRTPLGGFYNHSEDPNCKLVPSTDLFQFDSDAKSSTLFLLVKRLFTLREIEEGEEITCFYTLYKINND